MWVSCSIRVGLLVYSYYQQIGKSFLIMNTCEGPTDNVRCFCCDGGLKHWQPNDDPWTEHRRWFSRCPYVVEHGEQLPTPTNAVSLSCLARQFFFCTFVRHICTVCHNRADLQNKSTAKLLSIILAFSSFCCTWVQPYIKSISTPERARGVV